MNAPIPYREPTCPKWDAELERNTIGLALLGLPLPDWLAPHHFFALEHQRIYETCQAVPGGLPAVSAYLRDVDDWTPEMRNQLAEMALEADHAMAMGWAVDFDRLRELWRVRGLLESMERVGVELRHGVIGHEEARVRLREHFREMRAEVPR